MFPLLAASINLTTSSLTTVSKNHTCTLRHPPGDSALTAKVNRTRESTPKSKYLAETPSREWTARSGTREMTDQSDGNRRRGGHGKDGWEGRLHRNHTRRRPRRPKTSKEAATRAGRRGGRGRGRGAGRRPPGQLGFPCRDSRSHRRERRRRMGRGGGAQPRRRLLRDGQRWRLEPFEQSICAFVFVHGTEQEGRNDARDYIYPVGQVIRGERE